MDVIEIHGEKPENIAHLPAMSASEAFAPLDS
jgi:hypothetical protein